MEGASRAMAVTLLENVYKEVKTSALPLVHRVRVSHDTTGVLGKVEPDQRPTWYLTDEEIQAQPPEVQGMVANRCWLAVTLQLLAQHAYARLLAEQIVLLHPSGVKVNAFALSTQQHELARLVAELVVDTARGVRISGGERMGRVLRLIKAELGVIDESTNYGRVQAPYMERLLVGACAMVDPVFPPLQHLLHIGTPTRVLEAEHGDTLVTTAGLSYLVQQMLEWRPLQQAHAHLLVEVSGTGYRHDGKERLLVHVAHVGVCEYGVVAKVLHQGSHWMVQVGHTVLDNTQKETRPATGSEPVAALFLVRRN